MILSFIYNLAVLTCVLFSLIVVLRGSFTQKTRERKYSQITYIELVLLILLLVHISYVLQWIDFVIFISLFIINLLFVFHKSRSTSVREDMYNFMTMHDHLTQLPNRNSLHQYIHQHNNHTNIAFLHINLDRFKLINNIFGYQVADTLLNLIAQRLNLLMQGVDKMLLFRLSGDELLLIIEEPEIQHSTQWAEKILEVLSQPFDIDHKNIYITSSIGIAVADKHGQTLQDLLIHADTAMTQAKKQGRNNYHIYDQTLFYDFEHLNKSLVNDLYVARQKSQLTLHYQAKFDMPSLKICGTEALLRWQHPELGLLYPNDFISITEQTGIIIPMTYWVLEETCRQAQVWRQQGMEHLLPISINIASLVFEQDKLLHYTEQFMQQYQIQADDLIFEITESTAMKNIQKSQQICKKIHQLGVKISIDDFGVGYSNFMYLKELMVDELKIDKLFMQNIEYQAKNKIILKHMIDLAKQLDLIATVEGVENQAQLDILQTLSCQKIQGFYLAKPVPVAELEQLFQKSSKID